jgi:hypothetical protein
VNVDNNDDYLTTLVSRTPLKGTTYIADRCQVHRLLTAEVLGEQTEEWVRDNKNRQNYFVDFTI